MEQVYLIRGKLPLPPGWETYWSCLEVKGNFETHLIQCGGQRKRAYGGGRSELIAWNRAILHAEDIQLTETTAAELAQGEPTLTQQDLADAARSVIEAYDAQERAERADDVTAELEAIERLAQAIERLRALIPGAGN